MEIGIFAKLVTTKINFCTLSKLVAILDTLLAKNTTKRYFETAQNF